MSITIFRASSGEQRPIANVAELKRLIQSGEVNQDDLCFYPGAQDWTPVRDVYLDGENIRLLPPKFSEGGLEAISSPELESHGDRPTVNYVDLPWYRKSEVNVALIMGGVFCVPTNLITWLALMTGQVYTKNRASDGSLRPWSWLMRVAATLLVVFQLFVCAGIVFVLAASFLQVPPTTMAQGANAHVDGNPISPGVSTKATPRTYDFEKILEEQRKRLAERTGDTDGAKLVASLEEAREAAVGTWTYVGPAEGGFWYRIIFKADGTAEIYSQPAVADDWGQPRASSWEPFTAKYTDTGKRYFGVGLNKWAAPLVFINTDKMRVKLGENDSEYLFFTRGDKFPFSK